MPRLIVHRAGRQDLDVRLRAEVLGRLQRERFGTADDFLTAALNDERYAPAPLAQPNSIVMRLLKRSGGAFDIKLARDAAPVREPAAMIRRPWTVAAALVAAALYAIALSDAVYELTSPVALSWHVLLRKTYSIGAFTLVGYLLRRALRENGRKGRRTTIVACIAGVAAYSAAIEFGQWLAGSHEGLGWNAVDTICGAIGGGLAVADAIIGRRTPAP